MPETPQSRRPSKGPAPRGRRVAMASIRKIDGKLGLLTVAAAALVSASACVEISGSDFPQYLEREEKQFTVAGKPEVMLSTFDGAIQIRPGSGSDVQVVVEKRATDKEAVDTIAVDARQDGNRITIDVKAPPHVGYLHSHHRHAKLIVTLPANADVTAKSGDGSIDVEGISGQLELRSGDGSIHGRRLEGDLLVHTGDGSIRLEGVKGTLRATTGDGSVRVTADGAPSGNWDISTGDGSV